MNWIIEFLLVIAAISLLLAQQASRYVLTAILGAGMFYWSLFDHPPAAAMLVGWMLFVPFAALLTLTALRRRLGMKPLLAGYRRMMPGMSDTERAALEAGTVWWEADLFSGRPDWRRLRDFPAPQLSA
jgi:acyl-CoA dehydrogenase